MKLVMGGGGGECSDLQTRLILIGDTCRLFLCLFLKRKSQRILRYSFKNRRLVVFIKHIQKRIITPRIGRIRPLSRLSPKTGFWMFFYDVDMSPVPLRLSAYSLGNSSRQSFSADGPCRVMQRVRVIRVSALANGG